MIGRRELTDEQQRWNARWGAPYGYQSTKRQIAAALAVRLGNRGLEAKARGPFGFQAYNNATRRFEYAWAYHAVPVTAGMTVVDVGGSHGGFQFALASTGARVINVDPGSDAAMGWPVSGDSIATLNKAFGTDVELRQAYLDNAGLADESVDRLYCISTIEHVPEDRLRDLVGEWHRLLKPGGMAVLTIDLFFDLAPFTSRASNEHGRNVSVAKVVEMSGLTLVQGDRSELLGFTEFDHEQVQSSLNGAMLGDLAPNVAQAFVLQK